MVTAQGCTPGALAGGRAAGGTHTAEEDVLRAMLRGNPNDPVAFARLAGIVEDRNVDTLTGVDPARAGGDAVWSLAEDLAGVSGAWFPLVEMARLSIHQDREGALRRLRTAVQRDRTGTALLAGLEMLRAEGHAREAVALGIGYFRPSLHDPKIGRALIAAAVEDGRVAETRRFLAALGDADDVADLRAELESLVAQAAQYRCSTSRREIDLREVEVGSPPER